MTEALGDSACVEDGAAVSPSEATPQADGLPRYLRQTYAWAYLWPNSIRLLDRWAVVSAILWGNYARLRDAAVAEFRSGEEILQPACVYGDFSPRLADHLGRDGRLVVCDVAPQQVENCRRKLTGHRNATVEVRDAASHAPDRYDAVCCFFLLHEMPDDHKRRVVDALLATVRPGGKVVFVDYHGPHALHPLRPLMSLVFDLLEPYAKALWRREISDFATHAGDFAWTKETRFGGLYQQTVARRTDRA